MLLNEHGLTTRATLDPSSLSCSDERRRVIAPPQDAQLLTFTSPGDCSSCQAHLAGLEAIALARTGLIEQVYVSYPAGMGVDAAQRLYCLVTRQAVCWDTDGRLWDAHQLSHTPVTVVVVDGRIVLMHDAPLVSKVAQKELVDSIKAVLKSAGSVSR